MASRFPSLATPLTSSRSSDPVAADAGRLRVIREVTAAFDGRDLDGITN
jgi:hypothetical protein